jgi:hypothetical protein
MQFSPITSHSTYEQHLRLAPLLMVWRRKLAATWYTCKEVNKMFGFFFSFVVGFITIALIIRPAGIALGGLVLTLYAVHRYRHLNDAGTPTKVLGRYRGLYEQFLANNTELIAGQNFFASNQILSYFSHGKFTSGSITSKTIISLAGINADNEFNYALLSFRLSEKFDRSSLPSSTVPLLVFRQFTPVTPDVASVYIASKQNWKRRNGFMTMPNLTRFSKKYQQNLEFERSFTTYASESADAAVFELLSPEVLEILLTNPQYSYCIDRTGISIFAFFASPADYVFLLPQLAEIGQNLYQNIDAYSRHHVAKLHAKS